jgi:phosphatidylinositol-3-phosphatase
VSVERPRQCADCGSPLADDQRYCLRCGARAGPRSPQLEQLVQNARARAHPGGARSRDPAPAPASAPAATTKPGRLALAGLRLPSPWVSALLVAAFVGFGVLIGNFAASGPLDTPASARSPLKVLLPASTQASTSASAATPAPSSTASGSEAPSIEAEPTPAPAPATSANPARTPAKAQSSSGGGATGSAGGSAGGQGESPGTGGGSSEAAASAPAKTLPPVKHVFVIMLSDEPYASVFGPASTAPYLSHTLEQKGELLPHYDAVAHEELANEVALLSGQGPTLETAANCPNYTEIAPASSASDEQVLGSGCVYPASTQTIVGQLAATHRGWRAYIQGIDEAGSQAGACAHPALGQADPTAQQSASTGPYATFRNPFVYFDSLLDSPMCTADDVGLASLQGDLASAAKTPSFSYIVPGRCNDGNPTPCSAGAPSGMAPANTFLAQVVPKIMASKAYKESGLIVITVDEAPSSGAFADSSSCCGQPLFPNAPSTSLSGAPRGGGTVGALLLSPFVAADTTDQEEFSHFSLLRTLEELFSLKPLGYAALPAVKSFEPAMFTAGKS